jgi:hypothetical protein
MIGRAIGLLALVLGPAAALYLLGYTAAAHYVALGTVLAAQMSLLARPVAGFSILLPLAYAAAAITAQSTGGVIALIVAVAAIVGAASSQGLQRGLLAILAATLIGSSEPAAPSVVVAPTLALFAGCCFGYLLARTLLRDIIVDARAVNPQTALSFAMLLAILVLVAWLASRAADLTRGWWIPFAVAAAGHPAISGSALRSLAILAATLLGTLVLVSVIELSDAVSLRVAYLVVLSLLVLTAGRTRRWLRALLYTPLLLLLVAHPGGRPQTLEYLQSALVACALVFGVALLGQWLLWTIRPDSGHAAA